MFNNSLYKLVLYKILISLCLFFLLQQNIQAKPSKAFGIVYQDVNNNREFDEKDKPLNDILISNSDEITKTNSKGEFEIKLDNPDWVCVIKPEGYEFPLNKYSLPDYYYLHYPEGNEGGLKYDGVDPTGDLPDTLFFPMDSSSVDKNFKANILGDTQIPRKAELMAFRDETIPELIDKEAEFGIVLGDIADDNLDIYPSFKKSIQNFDIPHYMVFGNHDVNFRSKDNSLRAESYRNHFGPDYYSFNYGESHFIVLNTVDYKGWDKEKSKRGGYFGGIDKQQMIWLKQDLEFVDQDKSIYLMTHIPLSKKYFNEKDLKTIFSILSDRKKVINLSGHTHTFYSWKFNQDDFQEVPDEFTGYTLGAVCGSWWCGPYKEDSIPEATCLDGMPNGFFSFEFKDTEYKYDYIPVGEPDDFQLRISQPHNTIHKDSLRNKGVIVNVFAGTEDCEVAYRIDDKKFYNMNKFTDYDPFMVRTHHRRINRDDWQPDKSKSKHLWKKTLPEDISEGVHIIKAKVTFPSGEKYETSKVFEVIGD